MKPRLFALILLLPATAFAQTPNEWQGKKVPQLILASGKTYTDVTFSKVEPDAVTITHAGGILRIPMEDLKPEAQQALGYDPEKAAAARKAYLQQKAATEAANAQRVAAERVAAAEKANAEEWRAAARNIIMDISQITDSGALAKITILDPSGGGVEGSELEFVEFDPDSYNLVDGDRVKAKAVPMQDPYRYTSVLGATKTVRRWIIFEE